MLDADTASLSEAHRAILDAAEKHAIRRSCDDEPVAIIPNAYVPLNDEEWALCEPYWRVAPQSILIPRFALDGVLSHVVDGMAWHLVWGGFGTRQLFCRRARSGHIVELVAAARPQLSVERQPQFARLADYANAVVSRSMG